MIIIARIFVAYLFYKFILSPLFRLLFSERETPENHPKGTIEPIYNEIKKEKASSSSIDLNHQNQQIQNKKNELSLEQQRIFNLIKTTTKNIFIQGQAGTGKSTFIRYMQNNLNKRIIIVSPTALAATNVGGVTIHSFFDLPISDFLIIKELITKERKRLYCVLKNTDILIIDEVSMVRPDILDAINQLSQLACKNNKPFGGIQIVLIGDLCQLPPVIKTNTYSLFKKKYGYDMPYFFDAESFKKGQFVKAEFTHVYRQEDAELLQNLSRIRKKENLIQAIRYFNTCIYNKINLETALTITPFKKVAENINCEKLANIASQEISYNCIIKGIIPKQQEYPSPRILRLKVGALVIFTKNDPGKWINGTSGIIEHLSEDAIYVRIIETKALVEVKRDSWKNYTYEYDEETDEIIEKEIGAYIQFPIQLGYALTIHKAQGKTLDSVVLDIGNRRMFAHGQLYVALSRTRKLQNIRINRPLDVSDVIVDQRVLNFLNM